MPKTSTFQYTPHKPRYTVNHNTPFNTTHLYQSIRELTFLSSGFIGCSSDTAFTPGISGRLIKLGPKFARTLACTEVTQKGEALLLTTLYRTTGKGNII
jgi:hypothetical protein